MIDASLIDVELPEDGYSDDVAAEDTPQAMRDAVGDALKAFPGSLWIEQKDRREVAREAERNHTRPLDYIDRFTNQSPTDECVLHQMSQVFSACRNRMRGISYRGPIVGQRLEDSAKFGSVFPSPLSVYAECNPNIRGGTSLQKALGIVTRRGFLPDKIQPRDYGFKHMMAGTTGKGGVNQSSGVWVPLSRFPEGYLETAAGLRAIEVILPETWEEILCLVLHGYAVGGARKSHAIPYTHVSYEEDLVGYVDSYDIIRWDSFRTLQSAVGGAYAIASVTIPDDWLRPAG